MDGAILFVYICFVVFYSCIDKQASFLRSEVFRAVGMKMAVFWNVEPYSLAGID
jgi:hypothetical protein